MRTGSALIVKQHFEATKPLHKRTEATQPIHLCETAHLLRSCFEFRKHSKKYTLYALWFDCNFAPA